MDRQFFMLRRSPHLKRVSARDAEMKKDDQSIHKFITSMQSCQYRPKCLIKFGPETVQKRKKEKMSTERTNGRKKEHNQTRCLRAISLMSHKLRCIRVPQVPHILQIVRRHHVRQHVRPIIDP